MGSRLSVRGQGYCVGITQGTQDGTGWIQLALKIVTVVDRALLTFRPHYFQMPYHFPRRATPWCKYCYAHFAVQDIDPWGGWEGRSTRCCGHIRQGKAALWGQWQLLRRRRFPSWDLNVQIEWSRWRDQRVQRPWDWGRRENTACLGQFR